MVKLSLPHPIPITNPTSPFRNFNFMRPIKIVGSDTDLHDYQVRIHLDRSNFPLEKCKPDGSDIRFRDDSGEILPYWIERWNAAEGVIWCKIPFIPAESSKFIWMIYGNPNAKSESNGNAVFELFDVQDIVGFWHFDEPQWTGITGEVKDETGVNHGTAYGGATTTSDAKYGRAGYFDGSNDYVEVPSSESLNITDAITIELWTKIDDAGSDVATNQYWISRGTGAYNDAENNTYLFYIVNAGSDPTGYNDFIRFTLSDGSSFYNTYISSELRMNAFDPNKWYHLVATWDGAKMKIYKNGVHISSADKNFSGSINSLSANLNIGRHTDGTRYFDGKIDELRIYKRALSPTEVQILYKNYMQKMGSYFNVRKYVTPAPVVIV